MEKILYSTFGLTNCRYEAADTTPASFEACIDQAAVYNSILLEKLIKHNPNLISKRSTFYVHACHPLHSPCSYRERGIVNIGQQAWSKEYYRHFWLESCGDYLLRNHSVINWKLSRSNCITLLKWFILIFANNQLLLHLAWSFSELWIESLEPQPHEFIPRTVGGGDPCYCVLVL